MKTNKYLTYFSESELKNVSLPEKFTYPFFYYPHPLTQIAVYELQNYLENQFDLKHNFGINPGKEGLAIGKMFGVLIVQDKERRIGYLSAFSGKLAGTNIHEKFVPPVFDMLEEHSFFLKEVALVNDINRQIEKIENDAEYKAIKLKSEVSKHQFNQEIDTLKCILKKQKSERKKLRLEHKELLSEAEYFHFESDLVKQSLRDKHQLRVLTQEWNDRLQTIQSELEKFENKIEILRVDRKTKSATLQKQLFEQYSFLNQYGESKSLGTIFSETVFGKPPSAAGECATPKLLQYAFTNHLTPMAMAEFWWGTSPKSEIRKHKQFYPACTGKCEPILRHMLKGIETEENPLLKNLGEGKKLEIIYEDDSLVVVNKPFDLLSVPGINVQDSVYTRLKIILKTEPLIIHRLDMPTSGLLVVAKTREVHKHIQRQFLNRKVKKRYTALLSGVIESEQGEIDLPLRLDIEDRPRQLVCFEFGKKSITKFKVIERKSNTTKVYFYPITGRTHQLRMHSAHQLGLNTPIVGDDLYGTSSDRLYLHAAYLEFTHPITSERMKFEVKEDF